MNKLLCPFCDGELALSWRNGEDAYLCDYCGVRITIPQASITHLTDIVSSKARTENKPLVLHFGEGKIGVSTCRQEGSEKMNELLLWNPGMQQAVGAQILIPASTTTDDLDVFARLYFHNSESAQVVIDALNRIISSDCKDRPLTLNELTEIDGEPVWIEDLEEPESSGWRICYWDRGKYLILHSIHSRGYLQDEYGERWLAYRSKPEGKYNEN